MSFIDDTRKVLQDVIAPDLRAINVRLDAVERVMNLRFEQMESAWMNDSRKVESLPRQSSIKCWRA